VGKAAVIPASTVAVAAAAAPLPRTPTAPTAPFELTVRAMSGAQRRHQFSAALARIVQAADPGGAVASMGGAELQAALLTRLAASCVASSTAAEGVYATGPVGGAVSGSALSGGGGDGGGVGHVGVSGVLGAGPGGAGASMLSLSGAGVVGGAGDGTTAGPLLTYLISALPDPVAHGVAIRLLGAMFVNETMLLLPGAAAASPAGTAPEDGECGAYARTLMTLAVGLVESDSVVRAKHLPRLLLDSPALPPPVLRLLRALCLLPLPPLPPLPGDASPAGAATTTAGTAVAGGRDSSSSGGTGRGRGRGKGKDTGEVEVQVGVEAGVSGSGACDRHGFFVDTPKAGGAVRWGGRVLPTSGEAVTLALSTLRDLILERPPARTVCPLNPTPLHPYTLHSTSYALNPNPKS
jgi:symplekin